MMDNKPLVSVGMPVYNGERFLSQALDSLLAQDYENFELIISDNTSEDATQPICLAYASRDRRIRYYRNDIHVGAVKNFNRVFELSKGKYFMWAAHDDLRDNQLIRKCVDALEKDNQAVLCCTGLQIIDEDDREVARYSNFDVSHLDLWGRVRFLLMSNPHTATCVYSLIRSEALKKTRLFRDVPGALPAWGSDMVLLLDLCVLGKFIEVPEVSFYYRYSAQSYSSTAKDRSDKPISSPNTATFLECLRTILTFKIGLLKKIAIFLSAIGTIYFFDSIRRRTMWGEHYHCFIDRCKKKDIAGIVRIAPILAVLGLPYVFTFRAWHRLFEGIKTASLAAFRKL